MTRKYEKIYLK